MFSGCKSLIYLNLFPLNLNNSINVNQQPFVDINKQVQYCIEDNDTQQYLLEKFNITSNCSDICFTGNNKKVDIINNTCIESCLQNGFAYEYNNICFEKCPYDTYALFDDMDENNNTEKECFDQVPQGYYCDSREKICKKCYETCKFCNEEGNEANNNCIECKDSYSFYVNENNITNCYKKCENYYYFDGLNYSCTETSECPIKYDKLITNKNKCIDICKNDDIYKYEYDNKCYEECPSGTIIINENDYICNNNLDSTININNSTTNNIDLTTNNIDSTSNNIDPMPNNIDSTINIINAESSYLHEAHSTIINNDTIIQKIITTSSQSKVIYKCNITDEINNDCKFLNIQNNTEIINIIKDNINLLYNSESGKSQIIKGENNTIFQITNGKNEKELLESEFLNDQDISIIDLGQCELKLKNEYNINENDSLIYLKQENTNAKASQKNVKYEIFEPYNFTKLNLSICEEDTINIYVKIDLSEETRNTYEYLKSLGYDMLNINDPFYQDICVPYTYDNNTDILLSDRIDYIYNNKDTLCQSNCEFSSYVLNSSYLNCTCTAVQNKEEDKQKFSGKKLYESFYDILKYSNFKILKCYKLTFSKKIFDNNIGNIIILIIFSFYFACFILFILKGIIPLKNTLKNINFKTKEKNDNNDNIIINIINYENKINQDPIYNAKKLLS